MESRPYVSGASRRLPLFVALVVRAIVVLLTLPLACQAPVPKSDPGQADPKAGRDAKNAVSTAAEAAAETAAASLIDPSLDARFAGIEALLALRPDLVPLRAILRDVAKEEIVEDSGWIDVAEVPDVPGLQRREQLLADLRHRRAWVRATAVVTLCRSGRQAADHQADILDLMHDRADDVRIAVVRNITSIDWNLEIRDALIAALGDQAPLVRQGAAQSLRGHADPEIVSALRRLIQDPDPMLRGTVIHSLGSCGAAAAPAHDEIRASTLDRELRVRCAALSAIRLLALTDPASVSAASRSLNGPPTEQAEALRTIAAMKQSAVSLFPQVIALSRDGPANVREDAVSAALAIVDRPRVGRAMLRVIEALRDPDDRVVRAAGGALRAFCAR